MKEIVETKNVKAVKNAVRNTINEKGMVAIIGEIGIGKTTMYNVLKSFWESHPHKFTVIEMMSFKSRNSRISPIMELLIQAMSPGAHVPHIIEKKYFMLRDHLRDTKKNIILVADEAQDLNMQTFRDIKKIHEIAGGGQDHLFSVVFFGKTDLKWRRLFDTPELGERMHRLKLEKLSAEELVLIAEKTFNLRFQTPKAKERFASAMSNRTPLDVQFTARSIRHFYGVPQDQVVPVTNEMIADLSTMTLKYQVNMVGLTQGQIAERASEELGKTVSRQRISETLNGKDSPLKQGIETVIQKMMDEHYSGKQAHSDAM